MAEAVVVSSNPCQSLGMLSVIKPVSGHCGHAPCGASGGIK